MSRTVSVTRLHQFVRGLPKTMSPVPQAPPIDNGESAELARELVQAFADQLARYRQSLGTRDERIDPAQPPDVNALLEKAPEDTHFDDLERLARVDLAQSLRRWEAVKQAARRQLDNGWRAGRALEYVGGSAWERACYLALRNGLCEAFPPRHIGEKLLIDEIAQFEMLRQKWVEVLAMHSRIPAAGSRGFGGEKGEDRKLTAVEATAEAVRMVERLQRLAQNALRMLLKCRGEKPPTETVDWYRTLIGSRDRD